MIRKILLWLVWAVWLIGMLVTKDNFGWKAGGLYVVGSVTYIVYFLLTDKKEG